MNAVITKLYFSLLVVFAILWLLIADIAKVPMLIFGYIYPYSYADKAFGKVIYLPILTVQIIAILTFIASVRVNNGKSIVINLVASTVAVVWFFGISFTLFVAHLH